MSTIFSTEDFIYLGSFFIIGYVINYYIIYFNRANKLPGPFPLPVIGNLHQYDSDMSVWIKWLQSTYGDMGEVWMGKNRLVWFSRIEYLEKIFKASYGNYHNRTPPSEALDLLDMTSKGLVLNRDYNKWSHNRKFFTKAILSQNFSKQSVKSACSLFSEMEKYWQKLNGQNIEIDMVDWMLRFSVESIFLVTTSEKSDALDNYYKALCSPEKYADTEFLIDHVRTITGGFEFFMMVPKFLHFIPNYRKKADKILGSNDWMRKYYLINIIKKRREEIEKMPINQELTSDMLSMLITFNTQHDKTQDDSIDQFSKPMNDEEISEIIMEAILGGVDTSSNTICYIIYYVCHYPEVKKRIFEEIQNSFDLNSNININYEDLSKLRYCEAVIKEVSRFKPISPLNFRVAENDDEINGQKIEASTSVIVNVQGIHMSKLYWKEPEKFNPDRFLPSTNKVNDENDGKIEKYSFQMFGAGLRMCPGRNLAMTQLKTLMVLLFGKYNIELADYSAPLKSRCTTTNQCVELKVNLIPRK